MDGSKRNTTLSTLALRGAQLRISELMKEMNEIYLVFPQLKRGSVAASVSSPATVPAKARIRRSPKWTRQMKREAAERMHKYWASRRANKRA